jgi:hypothetical protein
VNFFKNAAWAILLTASLAAGPLARAAGAEPAAEGLVPEVHGFTALTKRLAPIGFSLHLVAASLEDRRLMDEIREPVQAAVDQINEHIGRGRIRLQQGAVADPAGLKGRPGIILIQAGSPSGEFVQILPRYGATDVHGVGGLWKSYRECVFGGTITLDRAFLALRDHQRETLPYVILHELLHAVGLDHVEEPYRGERQVMRCGVDTPDQESIDERAAQAFEKAVDEFKGLGLILGAEDAARLQAEIKEETARAVSRWLRESHRPILGQGDINGLRYLTREDPRDEEGIFIAIPIETFTRQYLTRHPHLRHDCVIL